MKIGIINGPNLNLLGTREPQIYGSQSFDDFLSKMKDDYPDHEFHYHQSNREGELIDDLQQLSEKCDFLILNAGAYTHTSIAIADAVSAISLPVIEVHISNVYKRENFRHHSYISPYAAGVIIGLGLNSYRLAVKAGEQCVNS